MSSGQEDSGDKTEQPTAQRLREARKKGDVSKSKELTSTVLVLGWLLGGWMMIGSMHGRINALFEQSLAAIHQPFPDAVRLLGVSALDTLLRMTLPLLALAILLGLLVEFLQAGPILAMEKLKPDLSKLNPVDGIKKMFSMDNLVELIKSIFKSAALIFLGVFVLWGMLAELLKLPYAQPSSIGAGMWYGLLRIVVCTIFVFFFVSALDVWYQKFSYIKKMRMSLRDIRDEVKQSEGDPYVKQRRRQLHQEWSQQNMLNAVRGSNVVVTNPTHIAIAIQYEDGITDLPVVVAKGEDYTAELIKRTAEESGIPILQNIDLARGLHRDVELDEYISSEFFEAVAEVLRWAEEVNGKPE